MFDDKGKGGPPRGSEDEDPGLKEIHGPSSINFELLRTITEQVAREFFMRVQRSLDSGSQPSYFNSTTNPGLQATKQDQHSGAIPAYLISPLTFFNSPFPDFRSEYALKNASILDLLGAQSSRFSEILSQNLSFDWGRINAELSNFYNPEGSKSYENLPYQVPQDAQSELANALQRYRLNQPGAKIIREFAIDEGVIREDVAMWFQYAEEDIADALILHERKDSSRRNILYHAQQSLEKMLKGIILAKSPELSQQQLRKLFGKSGHSVNNGAENLLQRMPELREIAGKDLEALGAVEGMDTRYRYPNERGQAYHPDEQETGQILSCALNALHQLNLGIFKSLQQAIVTKRYREQLKQAS